MTRAEIRLFVERYAAEWERADAVGLASRYAADAVIDSPIFHVVSGRAQIERSFRDLFAGLSDWSLTISDVVIDTEGGERAVMVATWKATHRGTMFGFPGSGRRLTTRSATAMRFENGLIKQETRLYDFTGLLVQLGVLKAKGA